MKENVHQKLTTNRLGKITRSHVTLPVLFIVIKRRTKFPHMTLRLLSDYEHPYKGSGARETGLKGPYLLYHVVELQV